MSEEQARLKELPDKPYITAVEAVSYLAYGEFLTKEEHAARLASHLKQGHTVSSNGGRDATPCPDSTPWDEATKKIISAHNDGKLALVGRKAPHFGAKAEGEPVEIPNVYFEDGKIILSPSNHFMHSEDATRAAYQDVALLTRGFKTAFMTSDANVAAFKQWVAEEIKQGRIPTIEDCMVWGRDRGLGRKWVQDQRRDLDPDQRRARGQKK